MDGWIDVSPSLLSFEDGHTIEPDFHPFISTVPYQEKKKYKVLKTFKDIFAGRYTSFI